MELAALAGQIEQLLRQAAGPFAIPPGASRIAAGPAGQPDRGIRGEFDAASDRLRQAEREHKQAQREVTRLEAELRQFDAQQRLPDREALRSQRDRRDGGWRLIRQSYIEKLAAEEHIKVWLGDRSASLPDQYEQEVAEADRLADDRQEKAEAVARREKIADDVARCRHRLGEAQRGARRLPGRRRAPRPVVAGIVEPLPPVARVARDDARMASPARAVVREAPKPGAGVHQVGRYWTAHCGVGGRASARAGNRRAAGRSVGRGRTAPQAGTGGRLADRDSSVTCQTKSRKSSNFAATARRSAGSNRFGPSGGKPCWRSSAFRRSGMSGRRPRY